MDRYAAKLAAENPQRVLNATHALVRDPVLLGAVFAERRLLEDVCLETAASVAAFERRTLSARNFAERVRGFTVTRCSLPLLRVLPTLTPNLVSLHLAASTTLLDAASIVVALEGLTALRSLSIVGQDQRTRRRRLLDHEPEGQVAQALRELAERVQARGGGLADKPRPLRRLESLAIRNTPLKLSTVDVFLETLGECLRHLVLDGCGLDARVVLLAEEFCPELREARLDTLISQSAPAATPRLRGPPIELLREAPLALSSRLTSLHLASLPRLPAATFSLFSSPHHASLRALSLLHCDVTMAQLSHFTSITRLRIVECPSIRAVPVFVDSDARPDLGAGCRALRQLSVLGRGAGLPLSTLWELAMLGREEIGGKGLARLTLDGTRLGDAVYNVSGLLFSFPTGLGLPSSPSLDEDAFLPSALPPHLAPPAHLAPYLSRSVLSTALPSLALLQCLVAAQDLEEVSIFGTSGLSDELPAVALSVHAVNASTPLSAQLAALIRRLVGGTLNLLPLVGPLFSPFHHDSLALPASVRVASALFPSNSRTPDLRLELATKSAFARDGLPSPPIGAVPLPCDAPFSSPEARPATSLGTALSQRKTGWLKRRFSVFSRPSLSTTSREGARDAEERREAAAAEVAGPRKRLRQDEVVWLLDAAKQSGGRLRQVYV
ncbi:uncharacterized protein JCM10292_002234 [Rhodotorula paludigena]|uniref:uncharacterized protein n=1 Tax=Rhodotorula paludigena TaxID=86838 RepID=UPI00316E6925